MLLQSSTLSMWSLLAFIKIYVVFISFYQKI